MTEQPRPTALGDDGRGISSTNGLTEARVNCAYRLFYGDGMALRMVATQLDCSIQDLSPWLTEPAMRIAQAAVDEYREENPIGPQKETGDHG